jgi:hypothetical protein
MPVRKRLVETEMSTPTLNDNSTVHMHPQVVLRLVEDEAVLLNLDDGNYYGLNAVGARMVELLQEGANIGTAYRTLLEEYDVEAERLRRDLEQLIGEMQTQGLVTVKP